MYKENNVSWYDYVLAYGYDFCSDTNEKIDSKIKPYLFYDPFREIEESRYYL